MTTRSDQGLQLQDLSEQTVEQYLQQHSDFFERHQALLSSLRIPHSTGGAVSLLERQVELLRDKNRQLERKLQELVELARANQVLNTRLHRLALGLMEAEDVTDVIATTKHVLRDEFPATDVVIRLLPGDGISELVADEETCTTPLLEKLFRDKQPLCGQLSQEQATLVFGDSAGSVASAVVLLLSEGRNLGLLALGSAQHDRFDSSMGTLFSGYLGELVSRALRTHILN